MGDECPLYSQFYECGLKRRRINSISDPNDHIKYRDKSTSTEDYMHVSDNDMEISESTNVSYPGIDNVEFRAILRMVSNRYDKNSHPPYIVYFTKVNNSRTNRCNNIFRAIKNQHTDYSKTDLQKGVILMEFTNYEVANSVIEHVRELRQLGWIAFIPTLKISRTVIIHNVDKSIAVKDVFGMLQANNFKILNIERLKKTNKNRKKLPQYLNSIKVTFKDPVIPDKLEIEGNVCYVKRYIPRTLTCDYCEKYERVNEDCRAFWEKMWKSHCKSNFSVEFECAICEGARKVYKDLAYVKRLEEIEINDIMRVLNVSRSVAKKIYKDFYEIEEILKVENFARNNDEKTLHYDVMNTVNEIITAIQQNDAKYIQDLHLNGMQFDSKINKLNQTALHLAILNRAPVNLIKLLIDIGADVNAEDIFCQSPLYLAITDGDDKILDSFVNINYSQELHLSLKFKINDERRSLIKLLLESGANVNPDKSKVEMPFPINSNSFEKIQDVKYCQLEGYMPITLLHLVTFIGDKEVLELLLSHGADINSWHPIFGSPIFMAVFLGHQKIVETLLQHGANVYRPLEADATVDPSNSLENMTLLHVATNNNREVLVKILLEHMFTNIPEKMNGENFIHSFIKYPLTSTFHMSEEFRQEVGFCELYVEYGPPNVAVWKILTPRAIYHTYDSRMPYPLCDYIMCMFIKNGLDINHKNKDGVSALEIAAAKGLDNPYVDILLKFGANINARNCNGATALHVGLRHKSLSGNKYWHICNILQYSPDFNIKDNSGRTASSYINDSENRWLVKNVRERRAGILNFLYKDGTVHTGHYTPYDMVSIRNEINIMKETPVTTNPYCSLHKFLKFPRDKLKSVLRNQHLVFNYKDIDKNKFRVYYPVIHEKFREAEIVNELEGKFVKSMNTLVQKDYPDFVADEIFRHLTLDEIRNVITASTL